MSVILTIDSIPYWTVSSFTTNHLQEKARLYAFLVLFNTMLLINIGWFVKII